MLTHKPCKWCGSIWHSKNKCTNSPEKPLKAVYPNKRDNVPRDTENPSERPRLAYKGNSERSQLIGWADKFFSLFIRTRGSDGWYNHCYTCGIKQTIAQLQCGHYMRRDYIMTRWNEMNCHPQCNDCNVTKHGNLIVYRRMLVLQYGELAVEELEALARRSGKFPTYAIQEVIDKYKGVVF